MENMLNNMGGTGGVIKLEHHGRYVAKFTVTWYETYEENGARTIRSMCWDGSGEARQAPYSTEIQLGSSAQRIRINVEVVIGVAWEPVRTIANKIDLRLVPERIVSIGGTTLNPTFDMEPNA